MRTKEKKEDNRKFAIYSRKSKFTGKGESTHNQIEQCKAELIHKFPKIDLENDIIVYEDEGYTGYNMDRPDFKRMMNDIYVNKIRTIAFYKLDRISRNVSDFSNLLNELDDYDVTFLSATENIDNVTPTGKAMMFMISVFAQLERDTIAERIRDNMIDLAKTGRWLGGNTPTGYDSEPIVKYDLDGKKRKLFKLTENDELATIVTLFSKMLELRSLTKLETYTLQNDMKTRNGKSFSRWGLKNILTNPVYAIADQDVLDYLIDLKVDIFAEENDFDGQHGLMVYNKTEKKGKSKAVVKRDIDEWIIAIGKHKGAIKGKEWVEVQQLLEQNCQMKYRKPTTSNALLSGILKCSHCGSYMRAKLQGHDTDSQGRRKFSYMCELKDKSKKVKCQCPNINGLEADKLVLEEITKLANPTSKFYEALKKISKDNFTKAYKDNEELKALKKQINKNENEVKALSDRLPYLAVELVHEQSEKIVELKKRTEELQKKVKELTNTNYDEINDKESADILINVLDTYTSSFDDLDLNTKRNMIKLLVSSITSDGEDITINLVGTRTVSNDEASSCACAIKQDFLKVSNFPTGEHHK